MRARLRGLCIAVVVLAPFFACGIDEAGLAPLSDASPIVDATSDKTILPLDAEIFDAGDASDVVEAAPPQCPSTLHGPPLVPVDEYCVDSTEVTVAQYSAFLLAQDAGIPDGGKRCAWVDDLQPDTSQANPSEPQIYVHWCDAYLYCHWAGKRLCGSRDAGALPWSTPVNDPSSQWHHACSEAGARTYAYGSKWNSMTCNDDGNDNHVDSVASFPQCIGGFAGLFDMTGNANEWIDSCDQDNGNGDNCRILGGDYGTDQGSSTCASTETQNRDHITGDWLGFRCCYP